MSRFSGLPDPLAAPANPAARFNGLRDALAATKPENGSRVASIRAAAAKAGGSSRLAAHQAENGKAISSMAGRREAATPVMQSPAPTPSASHASPKPAPTPSPSWQVPAEVAAKGAGAELGYRITFEAVSDQLGRMSAIPAAKGRIGSLIEMVASGSSDAEIRAGLAEMPTDRQRQISATWDAAIASVCADRGSALSSDAEADGPQPRDAARQRMIAVASDDLFVANEANALGLLTKEGLYGLSASAVLDVLALTTGSDRSAEAVWDRAHAAVFGTAHAPKSDPHGWQAIHADIRERRG